MKYSKSQGGHPIGDSLILSSEHHWRQLPLSTYLIDYNNNSSSGLVNSLLLWSMKSPKWEFEGFDDWYIPSIKELQQLINNIKDGQQYPAITKYIWTSNKSSPYKSWSYNSVLDEYLPRPNCSLQWILPMGYQT